MINKKRIILAAIIVLGAICATFYVWQGKEKVEVQTHGYLLDKGYTNEDIATIQVQYSFVNQFSSYDVWTSAVEFMDQPKVTYHFAWREETIVSTGVSGEVAEKGELKDFS